MDEKRECDDLECHSEWDSWWSLHWFPGPPPGPLPRRGGGADCSVLCACVDKTCAVRSSLT